ncbi:MAG: hypothetical protein L0Z50_35305, partial [Verrucomicrobiales bacterium]|nr:hypothetical protein [Verrucomicrobiales bacterium]
QRGLSMSLEVTRTMKEKRHRGVMSHRIYQVDEVGALLEKTQHRSWRSTSPPCRPPQSSASPPMQDLMRDLLRQVVAVANAQNIPIDFNERWDAITGLLCKLAPNTLIPGIHAHPIWAP